MSATTAAVRPAGYSVIRVGARGRFLLHRRAAVAAAALVVLLAVVCVAYLCVGESFVAPGEVLKVVLGGPPPTNSSSARCGCRAWSSGCSSASPSGSPAR